MKAVRIIKVCIATALLVVGSNVGSAKVRAAEPRKPVAEHGIQVLTRGPVHEAFAETVSFNPEPGIVVPKAPPEAIEEVAPDQRPEGANVAWIPGYWAWDDERSDFLWVSGI
jgi:YXWGXW repeat-containing protein